MQNVAKRERLLLWFKYTLAKEGEYRLQMYAKYTFNINIFVLIIEPTDVLLLVIYKNGGKQHSEFVKQK